MRTYGQPEISRQQHPARAVDDVHDAWDAVYCWVLASRALFPESPSVFEGTEKKSHGVKTELRIEMGGGKEEKKE